MAFRNSCQRGDETVKRLEVQAGVDTARQASPARLHYLDYLRAGVVALVFLHHTAITYGASGSWYYADAGPRP